LEHWEPFELLLKKEETQGVVRSQDFPDVYSILSSSSANTKHRYPLNLPEHARCYFSEQKQY